MREPGIYYDIPNPAYHADKTAIGNSGLKLVMDCPALYFGQYLDPERPPTEDKESAAQLFGNMTHCALFEHAAFNHRYRIGPVVSNKNVKAWQDFKKECGDAGASAIDGTQYKIARQIRKQALALPDLKEALLHPHGRGEVSTYWRDPATGVLCKCRPDWVMPVGNDGVVLWDAKTFATGDAREFGRQVPRMRYHLQAAWYADGYAKATGKNVLAFVFIVIGDEWPHAINLVMLDDEAMRAGQLMYRGALDTYAECLKTGVWPGYAPGIKTITLPRWALEDAQ